MAKALILYFSQCGHTRSIAERICSKLETNSIKCELVDIMQDTVKETADCKLVFIGTPVYYGMEPLVWEDYVRSLPDLSGKAGFVFSTYGADSSTRPDSGMIKNLRWYFAGKGLKILSSQGTVCEDTFAPLKKVGLGAGRPNDKDLQELDIFVEGVITDLRTGKLDRAIYDYSGQPGKSSTLYRFMLKITPKVRINAQNCTKCGICVKVCPVKNIEMKEKVRVNSNCIKCYQCERVCKSGGIKVNWMFFDALCALMSKKAVKGK